MKKAILIVLLFLCIISLSAPAYCDDSLRKLGRGVCNSITFPFEIPLQIKRTNDVDGPMAAWTYGLLKGVGMTCVRAVVGVYEVITFPIPYPKNYEPLLRDPEFFLEDKRNW